MTPFLRLLFWLIQIVVLHYFNIFEGESLIGFIYYIDTSVLLENIPLEKFTKTTSGTRVVYFQLSHTWVYRWRNFRNFHPKFVGVLRLLNFTYTFFKALLIFCHCSALFSSVLFLKIIVNNVLYCCTVNLSRHNYFLANKNLLFYRCLFVYIIKRTLHSGLKIWILFSSGKTNILNNIVWPLENKIHIFAPPCNILYLMSIHNGEKQCFEKFFKSHCEERFTMARHHGGVVLRSLERSHV